MIARVYAFAVVTVLASVVLLFAVLRIDRGPPWMGAYSENVVALAQQLGERYPTRDALIAALPAATARMTGELAVYDDTGAELWRRGRTAPAAPSAAERAAARGRSAAIDEQRIVVELPGHAGLYLVDDSDHVQPGLELVFAVSAVLVFVLATSLWFARGLARPLRQLEGAARAFGAGDTAARARVSGGGELGAVGAAFDQMADRIEHLLRSQRELLADISHELRTPLARIRVALELATEDPAAARDVLADVGLDLTEIDQIIDDLLTVVRLDLPDAAGGVARRPVAVDELVRRAADRFAGVHPGRALRVDAPDAATVVGDAVLLRRALDNLLDNAAKYSPRDAPVIVEARADAGAIRLDVVDRGIGMSPDELDRAFTPFWRADASRTRGTGGTGLGLALARRVARAHGGDVTLRSVPGAGTTASLTIPRA